MLSHGLTTGGLFLGIGVLYERRHTRRLAEYGGIWKQMPIFAGLFLIIVMGSAGLPALSGFIGEFLTIFGTFNAGDTFPAATPHYLPSPRLLGALAATGVILGAIYLLYMFQKVFFGKLDKARNGGLQGPQHPRAVGVRAARDRHLLDGPVSAPVPHDHGAEVQKFMKDYGRRVAEPDGPSHVYGTLPAAGAAGLQKNLDAAAKSADGVAKAIKPAGAPSGGGQ